MDDKSISLPELTQTPPMMCISHTTHYAYTTQLQTNGNVPMPGSVCKGTIYLL